MECIPRIFFIFAFEIQSVSPFSLDRWWNIYIYIYIYCIYIYLYAEYTGYIKQQPDESEKKIHALNMYQIQRYKRYWWDTYDNEIYEILKFLHRTLRLIRYWDTYDIEIHDIHKILWDNEMCEILRYMRYGKHEIVGSLDHEIYIFMWRRYILYTLYNYIHEEHEILR